MPNVAFLILLILMLLAVFWIAVGLLVYGLIRAVLFIRRSQDVPARSRWTVTLAVALLPVLTFVYLGYMVLLYGTWCDQRGVSPPYADILEVPVGGDWGLRIWDDGGQYAGTVDLFQQGPRERLSTITALNTSSSFAYGEVHLSPVRDKEDLLPKGSHFVLDTMTNQLRYASDAAAMAAIVRQGGHEPAPLLTPKAYFDAHRWFVLDALAALGALLVPVLLGLGLRRWTKFLLRQAGH